MSLPRVRASVNAARRRPLPRLVAAVLLGSAGLWASPLAAAPVAASDAPLPACRYDDVVTAPRTYADWSTTLVDTILRAGRTYVPPDLVKTSTAGIGGGGMVRAVAIDDLRSMTEAALANGTPIAVESSYRSYTTQIATFQHWVDITSYGQALRTSARPGHSEHQLGVAIDFRSATGGPPWSGADWARSPAGAWMKAHAWEYGWLMSYPRGTFKVVCYDYEPWHYRYVGRELAASIHASGLTIRQYLWRHFTTASVPPPTYQPPLPATGSPAPSATASPSVAAPSASPAVEATPVASSASLPVTSPRNAPASPPALQPAAAPGTLDGADMTLVAAAALGVVTGGLLAALSLIRRRSSRGAR